MPPKEEDTEVEDTEAAEGVMITTPKEAVEAMREEVEEDTRTGEGEEEEVVEGGRCREIGGTEGEGGVTARATIKKREVTTGEKGEEGEEDTAEEASKIPAIMEEEVVEGVTTTITAKMAGAGTRRGEGAVEVVGAGGEEDKEVAGEAEGVRILIKGDSLNSSSNMEANSTASLASVRAETSAAEDGEQVR